MCPMNLSLFFHLFVCTSVCLFVHPYVTREDLSVGSSLFSDILSEVRESEERSIKNKEESENPNFEKYRGGAGGLKKFQNASPKLGFWSFNKNLTHSYVLFLLK